MENHELHDREAEENIRLNIAEHGYFIALFHSDGYMPAMAYTIGLFETFQHPELIIFGLDLNEMGDILNGLVMDIKTGKQFVADQEVSEILEGYNVHIAKVDSSFYAHYLGYAIWYYKDLESFPVLQLIWPDNSGKWPWEKTFNQDLKYLQPLPNRTSKSNFIEDDDLSVFTTKQVINGKPILHVFHNDNGDWQFHGEEIPKEEDGIVVCLKELIKMDPSLNEVFFLHYGEVASRPHKGGEWTMEAQEMDE